MEKNTPSFPVQRLVIVGSTGSGKTTLARAASLRLHIPVIEMDSLYWGPGWTPTPRPALREKVAALVAADAWVVDGSYRNAVGDIVWSRADTLVWLDYPLRTILWRVWCRTVRRLWTREVLWNGNRERFRTAFLSKESLFVWAVRMHARRRREYAEALPLHPLLAVVRLRSAGEVKRWLASLDG